MIILFIGNFEVDYCTEVHHKKTYEKLGHTVIPFQENRTSALEVMKYLLGADILVWTHTHSWRVDSNENIIKMLSAFRKKNIPTVGYHLDLWKGLEREKDLSSDPYWNIEHFFTVDKLMADWLNENTNTKGHFLPAGVFEDECYIAEPNHEKYPHEIVFTGSKGYHKEHGYRPKLIEWLQRTYGDRFAHYGGGGLPTLRGHELNVMYASAKIAVGDTLCKGFDYPFYLSDRAFEQPGRGAFTIFPYIRGIEFMYELGKEIVTYKFADFGQLKALIDYYISEHGKYEREQIRLAGHIRAKNTHTYTHRLSQLLETLEKEKQIA